MSQYVIIFLLVAVFRGVVWVVQKVQQNAKAREALMAQQASASMGGPNAVAGVDRGAPQAVAGGGALPAPSAAAAPAPRTARPAQRGQISKAARGSALGGRGSTAAQGNARPSGTATGAGRATPGARTTAAAPRRDVPVRPAQSRPTAPLAARSSRAEAREARVGQSSSDIRKLLLDRTSLRQALLAREILGPPRGMTA